MVWLLVLLLPLTLFGQIDFEPVRLDTGTTGNYFSPAIWPMPDGNFLCTCGEVLPYGEYVTRGQRISAAGEPMGALIYYETADCSARTIFVLLPDGRETQLFYHS